MSLTVTITETASDLDFTPPDPEVSGSNESIAVMLWEDLAHEIFPCSGSEEPILTLATSLVRRGEDCNLRDCLSGLDSTNTRLVLRAVAHAAGHIQIT